MYCYTLHKINGTFINEYSLNDQILNLSDQHTYLGVTIHKHLSWTPHITGFVAKASRTPNFLKHYLSNTSRQVKEFAYLTKVRPQLEYASDIWDLYYVEDIVELEKVQ